MSGSNYQPGQVLTAAQLNSSFDGKTDNAAASITGGTIEGITSLEVSGTSDSTSPQTGAVVIAGGVGIALDVQVGGTVTVAGEVIANSTAPTTSTTTGAVVVAGGVGIGGGLNVGGSANVGGALSSLTSDVTSTQNSTNTATGALVVAGGVGIAANLNVGGSVAVVGAINALGAVNVSGLLQAQDMTLMSGGYITFADGSTQASAGAINGELTISTTGGVVSVSAAQAAANSIFKVSGALASNVTLVFPAAPKSFIVDNATTGAFSTVVGANGVSPTAAVTQGSAASLFTDSTGCYSTAGVSLPLPISQGGTGQTTQPAALTALLGSSLIPIANMPQGAAGSVLTGNGAAAPSYQTFASNMTAWFNALPTTFPATAGVLWNNGGTLAQS